MRFMKRIRAPDALRELLCTVTRSVEIVILQAERILPRPDEPGQIALHLDLGPACRPDRVPLAVYSAKARGALNAAEADELIEIAATIRSALSIEAANAATGRAQPKHRGRGR